MSAVEALDADRQPVDAERPELRKFFGLECARIGLQGHFRRWIELHPRADTGKDAVQSSSRKQARGATAEEHARHAAAPDLRQSGFEIAHERLPVLALQIGIQ